MLIRPCVKTDLKQCEKLFDLPELATASGGLLPAGYLEHFLDKKYFLAAIEKNKVIGAIYGEPLKAGGAMLWGLAVKEKRRNQGIGSELLGLFEKNARLDNRKWIVLHASTKSRGTVRFYKRHNYSIGNKCAECAKDLV